MTPTELKRRRSKLGGSEISAVLNLSPFTTAAQLWDEKMGLVEPKPTSDAMLTGIYLEDGIAKLWAHRYAAKMGVSISMRKHRPVCHPVHKFMRASPDRLLFINRGGFLFNATSSSLVDVASQPIPIIDREGLEVKCISAYSEAAGGWGRSGSQDYPEYYKAQCAWNRMIFDLPRWNLVALTADGRYTIKHYIYEKDLAYEQTLIDAGLNFWNNHILKKVRPEEKPLHRLTSPDPSDIVLPPPPAYMAAQ